MTVRMYKGRLRGWAEAKAENLQVVAYQGRPNMAELRFDFACPNCGVRHHKREITRRYFDRVGYSLKCGNVQVSLGTWEEVFTPLTASSFPAIQSS